MQTVPEHGGMLIQSTKCTVIPNSTRCTDKSVKKVLAQGTSEIRSGRKWVDVHSKGQEKDGTMIPFVAFSFKAVGLARSTEKASSPEKWLRGKVSQLISSFSGPPKLAESQVHAQRTKWQMFMASLSPPSTLC